MTIPVEYRKLVSSLIRFLVCIFVEPLMHVYAQRAITYVNCQSTSRIIQYY